MVMAFSFAGCGQTQETSLRGAGQTPLTFVIDGSQVGITVDRSKGAPPRDYPLVLICGNMENDRLINQITGSGNWQEGSFSSEIIMSNPVDKSDLCQLHLASGPGETVFLNNQTKESYGQRKQLLDSLTAEGFSQTIPSDQTGKN